MPRKQLLDILLNDMKKYFYDFQMDWTVDHCEALKSMIINGWKIVNFKVYDGFSWLILEKEDYGK